MDLDVVAFIDENGFEDYDIWGGDNPEMGRKYVSHEKKLKDLIMMP